MPPPLKDRLNIHYAPRAADHIPHTGGSIRRYLWTGDPEGQRPQAGYRGRLASTTFTPVDRLDAVVAQKALFLPYIRMSDIVLPGGVEWVRYGLPPDVTRALKNKVRMQTWMAGGEFAPNMLNFIACTIDAVPEKGARMLRQIEAMYAAFGVGGRYPLGLVMRGEWTDGNYGSAVLVEALERMRVEGRSVHAGQVMVKRDGQTANLAVCDSWAQALECVRRHLAQTNDIGVGDRVVITRLIDVLASPGMCAAVTGGMLYIFPFNGQYIAPGHTACTGTCSFELTAGARAGEIANRYWAQSRDLLAGIYRAFMAGHPDRAGTYAMLNIDLLIPGRLEAELWQRAHNARELVPYLDNLARCDGDYAPRVYDPGVVLMTEINPRDTNWTIAMKAVLAVRRQLCTLGNLLRMAEGRELLVLARDHWPLPAGVPVAAAREKLLALHEDLVRQGDGVIMRMPDNPAGMILYTESGDPARLAAISETAYRVLEM